MDLHGKISVVTGAAQGNGFGIAEALAGAGSHVILSDINQERLASAVQRLTDRGDKATGVTCDVTDEDAVDRLMAAADDLGGPHIRVLRRLASTTPI